MRNSYFRKLIVEIMKIVLRVSARPYVPWSFYKTWKAMKSNIRKNLAERAHGFYTLVKSSADIPEIELQPVFSFFVPRYLFVESILKSWNKITWKFLQTHLSTEYKDFLSSTKELHHPQQHLNEALWNTVFIRSFFSSVRKSRNYTAWHSLMLC